MQQIAMRAAVSIISKFNQYKISFKEKEYYSIINKVLFYKEIKRA
mgnify:CR=1 FL=1